jgi:uncharacterized DUF497 family protein
MLWWTQSSEDHVARHDVAVTEVTEVVSDPSSRWFKITKQPLFHVFGQTQAGRYLLVVLVRSTHDSSAWFVVTARNMTDRERNRYHRK